MEDYHQFEAFLKIFAESVLSQHSAIQTGDASLANLSGRKHIQAAKELLSSGPGIKAFATLLRDKRIAVSSAAAAYLLPHKTAEATLVLEEAAKRSGAVGLGAVMALARWKAGEKGMWEEVSRIAKSRKPQKGNEEDGVTH